MRSTTASSVMLFIELVDRQAAEHAPAALRASALARAKEPATSEFVSRRR